MTEIPSQMPNQMPPQTPWVAPAVSAKKMQEAPPVQMETEGGQVVRPAIDTKLQGVIASIERNERVGYFGPVAPGMPMGMPGSPGMPMGMPGAPGAVTGAAGVAAANPARPFVSNLDAANEYLKLSGGQPGMQAYQQPAGQLSGPNAWQKTMASGGQMSREALKRQESQALTYAIIGFFCGMIPFAGLFLDIKAITTALKAQKQPESGAMSIAAIIIAGIGLFFHLIIFITALSS